MGVKMTNKFIDFNELKEELFPCIAEIVQELLPHGRQEGNEWVALNPTRSDRNIGSFRICISGDKSGSWIDFATTDSGNDIIALYAYIYGRSYHDAALELAEEYKESLLQYKPTYKLHSNNDITRSQEIDVLHISNRLKESLTSQDNTDRAQELWIQSEDINDSPVEKYLRYRNIIINENQNNIRSHKRLYHSCTKLDYPAMVCAVKKYGSDVIMAIHRTYLGKDTNGNWIKADITPNKMSLGRIKGGAVQIGNIEKSDTLILSEGVEDALTLHQLKEKPVWAVLGAYNYQSVILPPQTKISTIILALDNDNAGQDQGRKAAQYIGKLGYEVGILSATNPYKDWNEYHQKTVKEEVNNE